VIAARVLTILLLRALPDHPAILGFIRDHQTLAQVDFGGCAKRKGAAAAIVALGLALASLLGSPTPAGGRCRGRGVDPAELKWSFAGPFGKYDRGELQRGFKSSRRLPDLSRFGAGVVSQPIRPRGLASRPHRSP